MRGLLWIVGIALLGLGALFLAWRLVPTQTRDGAQPAAAEPGQAHAGTDPQLAPVEASTDSERAAQQAPPQPEVPVVEAPPADGLEEGGLAQAARPLPDFGARYAGTLRSDRLLAAGQLERAIAQGRAALTRAETEDLDARLANQPRADEPTPRVAALLAQADELAWLRQQLALPRVEDR